jgi:hypothetical protein
VVLTQQVIDAFRDLLRAELTALCQALQGHIDELFRRQESLERAVLALLRRQGGTAASDDKAVGESQAKLARRKKAGPRQRSVTPDA